MADNITLDPGTSGAVVRTDDDGTAHWQYFKIAFGADNTQSIVTSTATNPLPVALSDIDNAVLDTINTAVVATQAAVETIDNAVSGAGFNVTQFGGVAVSLNTGVRDTGTQRVTIATNDAVPVTNAGLTELAAAINSSRVDVNIAASGATITVASHAVTNAGTFAVQAALDEFPAAAAITDDSQSAPATTQVYAHAMMFDGSAWDRLKGDATNGLLVNMGSNNDVTVSGTVTANLSATDNAVLDTIDAVLDLINAKLVTGTVIGDVNLGATDNAVLDEIGTYSIASATSLAVMDDWDNAASDGASVSGDVAHDAADAGEPLKIGAVTIAHGTNPTAVGVADRTNLYANRAGIPFVIGGHPNVIGRTVTVLDSDGAQTNLTLVGAIGSGAKVVVTACVAICSNANSGDVSCRIGFGASAVPTAALAGVNGMVIDHPGIAAGSGVARGDGNGIVAVGGDGEELRLTCADPAGGSLTVTLSYYTIES